MAATVTELGARVLRRLGVAAVAASDRPTLSATITATDIATRALQRLGIIVPEADRPSITATSTVTDIGARTLETLGVVVPASERPAAASVVTVADVAAHALQRLAVTVPEVDRPVIATTITATNVAVRALQALGIPAPTAEWPALSGSVTVAAIGLDALQRLGVVASDETPAAADTTLASAQVTAVHDQLVQQGVISWASSAIPRQVALDYAILTMRQLAPSFGTPAAEVQALVAQAAEAYERLRKQASVVRAQGTAESQAAATHANLVGAGIASWTSSAIPLHVSDEYVELTRQEVAAVLGLQLQGAPDKQVLQERIRRAAHIMRAQADAVAVVTAVHDGLARRGLASWTTSAIPAGVREPLAGLVAIDLAATFGVQADRSVVVEFEAQFGRVAQLARAQTAAEARVNAVHEALVGRGAVSWASSAIPRSVSEEYVIIARFDLAPTFGVQVDPAAAEAAEARIKRFSVVSRAQTLAVDRVAAVHESLVAAGLVSFASNAIPRALSEEFSQLVAMDVGPSLGVEVDLTGVDALEQRVKRRALIIGGPAIAERAIRAVHDDLTARGKTRWSWSDLPVAAERPYVVLAANSIAYEFQVPPDQFGAAQAIVDLARLISLPSSGERVTAEYF
jgi:hypothetical protein